ncbi:hypothetical protein LSAT2_007337 [Lamellibrachia satsuma]|nr:hypothetical protein LSAT2_007337 [Lamellibrachia satsuma]
MTGRSYLLTDIVINIGRPLACVVSQRGRPSGSTEGRQDIVGATGTGQQTAVGETQEGGERSKRDVQRGMATRKSKMVVALSNDKKNDRTKKKRNAFEVLTNKSDMLDQPSKKKSTATTTETTDAGVGRAFGAIRSRQNAGGRAETISQAQSKLRRKAKVKSALPDMCVPRPIATGALCSLKELSSAVDDILLHRPPDGVADIDAGVDHFRCPEYAWDMIDYLLRLDEKYTLQNGIVFSGEVVNSSVRAVLVDWLIQVQDHLQTHQETLHLCISLLDDFLGRQKVSLNRVQLLGISCLFIACKFEERFAPSVSKLIHLTDDTYTYDQVIKMEIVVLRVLNFRLSRPTPTIFLDRFLASHEHSKKVSSAAHHTPVMYSSDTRIPVSVTKTVLFKLERKGVT